MSTEQHLSALRAGSRLSNYVIDAVLGAGGFGITYRAIEDITGRKVAIKEYLPAAFAVRDRDGATVRPLSGGSAEDYNWGLERFREEAKLLIEFRHPNIVPVLAYFEAHGTGYLVMEFQAGASLGDMLEKRGVLPEAETKALIPPLLDGIEYVHARNVLHRDIKPDNIFVRGDGSPVLLDFGAARQALGEHSKKLTTLLTEGYAPFEQYAGSGNQGPWSDIHAFAAVLFRCIVGKPPTPAPQRAAARLANLPDPIAPDVAELRLRCSVEFAEAIIAGLAVVENERPRSVAEFRARLKGFFPVTNAAEPSMTPAAITATPLPLPPSPTLVPDAALRAAPLLAARTTESHRRRRAVAIAAGLAALMAAGATIYVADNRSWLPDAAKRAQTETIAPAQAAPPPQNAPPAKETPPAPPKQAAPAMPNPDSMRGWAEYQQRQLEQAEAERRATENARAAEADRKRREEEAAKEADRKRADEEKLRADDDRRAREAEERNRAQDDRRRAEERRGNEDGQPPRVTPAAPPTNGPAPRRPPNAAPPGNWPPAMPDPRRVDQRRPPAGSPPGEDAILTRRPPPVTLDRPNLPNPDEY